MVRKEISELLSNPGFGEQVFVKGWVRAFRSNRFIALNDGSTFGTIQVVVDHEKTPEEVISQIGFHACVAIRGTLVESQGAGQSMEIQAEEVEIIGGVDLDKYPLQPKRQTMEFLREKAHLRMRTNTFSAVFRIRHAVAFAIHKYYHEHGFYYLNTPIVTGSDAEGAGEMFRVTTFDPGNAPKNEAGGVDYKADFFGKATNLTVSGQLQAESGALALGKVYTFGPTFRAENSNTSRHLAEFWMIEPEMAFYDINDNM
ncbi:MAG: asparagine--tRNA ligase, partial [Saprospiraceae bacterium]|nr:asparagine--tRNA ligase [Saprospiraceae bacterium]